MEKVQNTVLKLIYTLVLAVAYGIFIGITIYTFYPAPDYKTYYNYDYDSCSKQYDYDYDSYKNSAYQKCMDKQEAERKVKQDEYEKAQKTWSMNVAIFLLVTSTLIIFGSVYLSDKMEIISNGFLLGSFFTLLSSVGFSFASRNKYVTFFFSLIVLAVTIFIGYIKLLNRKNPSEPIYSAPMNNLTQNTQPEQTQPPQDLPPQGQ